MIYVEKRTPSDPEWAAIVAKGKLRRAAHIASFDNDETFEIDAALYKHYMRFLEQVFGGKCAYCEGQLTSNQPGDVEHFRPKGRLVDDKFKIVRVQHPTKGEIDHPGYFWLAYDWNNLLPACIDCNRYRNHGRDAPQGAGKADRFPLDGTPACVPDLEADEKPLLINPSHIDPALHFQFNQDGTVTPLTEEGRATIALFGLNLREGLVEARRRAFESASEFTENHVNAVVSNNQAKVEVNRVRLEEVKTGRRPYSAMERLGIRVVSARIRAEQDRLLGAGGGG